MKNIQNNEKKMQKVLIFNAYLFKDFNYLFFLFLDGFYYPKIWLVIIIWNQFVFGGVQTFL